MMKPHLFWIFVLLLPLPQVERWIDKPQEKWPQIAMINRIEYVDKKFEVAGCGFLFEKDGKVFAATAKHVLTYFRSEKMDSPHFRGTLKSWKMLPKNNPKDVVVVDRLINEDEKESLEKIPAEQDWLLFTVKERSGNIQVLKLREKPLRKGEKIYIVGWKYTDKNCTQRIYEGSFDRYVNGSPVVVCEALANNKMPGLSGCPVIDASGEVIGLMSRGHGEKQMPSSTAYPLKLLKKK
jgi:hypothetical protein